MHTTKNITKLQENEVFVFGSNLAGKHMAGAALTARDKFGAVEGVGEGLRGSSYAFPTLNKNLTKRSKKALELSRDKLYETVAQNDRMLFLLTEVGTGIAGYTEEDMIGLFKTPPANLWLPEAWGGTKLYKVLTDGQSRNGGSMNYSLPTMKHPGKWHVHDGKPEVCSRGFHVTTQPYKWMGIDSDIYEAEVSGLTHVGSEADKISVQKCRLLRKVDHEQWWLDAKAFIKTLKDVKWFSNAGELPKTNKIKMFDTYSAARGAAWDAARDAARDAAWGAARDAAWGAARDAAWGAARDAAWGAARGAAWGAARDAAWGAALYTCAIHIASGLNVPKKHIDYAKLRWAVVTAGYGVACDVNGILYCYKKPV
jgi:hypothetical protein